MPTALLLVFGSLGLTAAARTTFILDANWKFNITSDPAPGSSCASAGCQPGTDDTTWRSVDLPHDFIVEGTFSSKASGDQGYLPYRNAWYRKHVAVAVTPGDVTWLDFDGIMTRSYVFWNGQLLGSSMSGYTGSRYFLEASQIKSDNVLAVFSDGSNPSGWWYDGGGIYRHVWLTVVSTPGPYLGPWGVYAPSNVTGPITWSNGAPFADASLVPSVEVWSNGTGSQAFSIALSVVDAAGAVVASSTGSGSTSGAVTVWTPAAPLSLTGAALWHLVDSPNKPALYTLATVLTVAGTTTVDAVNVTFGVRNASFAADSGFWLNGVNTKIFGSSNHQDFAAVGVAVPDRLQHYRVQKLKDMGGNGWRTAHNPPSPGLLDACDELGTLVWDENHRNGQDSQIPLLVRRDRNHPSVVIWSICNELLCNTNSSVNDALRLKALIKTLDPLGTRPVSANSRDKEPFPVGTGTPEDLQGIDYTTELYDSYHARNPTKPMISSESSSSYSDRDEFLPDANHVSPYNQFPKWGESCESAWGGHNVSDGQGIMTRPFISGGFSWTGWDYRGEETPNGWPDVSSHFGSIDFSANPKDRYFYYQSIYSPLDKMPVLHVFPNWDQPAAGPQSSPIWAYTNAAAIELFINGASAGRKAVPLYGHVEWPSPATWTAGSLHAIAYNSAGAVVAETWRNTTGPAVALRLSVKDGVGATLMAGCQDAALVSVEVVDAAGRVVSAAANVITLTSTGPGHIEGAHNGDPSSHVGQKSNIWPVYHGLLLGVVLPSRDGNTGTITVTASTPGFSPQSVDIPLQAPLAGHHASWCRSEPAL